jgi:tRNA(Arg) A34 adenosine deaminase TadA
MAMESHVTFMRRCIELAELARKTGDFPVGALIVQDSRIISEATEAVRANFDITAHAETLAIRRACSILRSIDLSGCILYTTAEPLYNCGTLLDVLLCLTTDANQAANRRNHRFIRRRRQLKISSSDRFRN